jgi:hypothetical protein
MTLLVCMLSTASHLARPLITEMTMVRKSGSEDLMENSFSESGALLVGN